MYCLKKNVFEGERKIASPERSLQLVNNVQERIVCMQADVNTRLCEL